MVKPSLENIDFVDEGSVSDVEIAHGKFENSSYGVCGVNVLVGHGVACENGGKYRGRYGCLDTDSHVLPLALQGKKCTEQIYQHPVFYSCHRPSCPKCFRSWLVREARSAEFRLLEAEKLYGKAEHIICSVPPERYGLDFKAMRALSLKALVRRGVIGGTMMFHAFRLNRYTGYWFFAPHFHVLGFISGGYKCRSCVKQFCSECHGFEAHTRECFNVDGFIVKIAADEFGVAGERRSVFDTLKYQLSHASIQTDVKRPHALTWFGVCSYRRLKVKYVPKTASCPYCGGGLVRLHYVGSKHFCVDRDSVDFVSDSVEDLREDGVVVWLEFGVNDG